MDTQAKTMAYKRDRHFGETKTIIAVTLFLFGFLSCFCLVLIWPQIYAIQVFNSKATYKLIIDVEDYFTCNEDYKKFVIDEPDSSYSMFSIYVFGVGNAADVFQRGAKPVMTETGPFGFLRHSYRYEISFDDPTRSETVSFKEFSVLLELSDVNLCEDMFYRTGRDSLLVNPCTNDRCKCKDYDTLLTIVNPMFLKLQWSESTSDLMAYYSVEVFSEVKALLEDPFTEAVRAHLVSSGLKEVYFFRSQMQMGVVMNTAMSDLSGTYDLVVIADHGPNSLPSFNPPACGLKDVYGISDCPFSTLNSFLSTARGSNKVCEQGCPSIKLFLDVTSNSSILNMDYGLPRWLGLSWYLTVASAPLMPFNGDLGPTMLTNVQALNILNDLSLALAEDQYGGGYTEPQLDACKYMTETLAKWMAQYFYFPYVALYSNLVQQEFLTSYQPVACSPFGLKCVWQYGYLRHHEGVDIDINQQLVIYLIDPTLSVNTNPASFYKDLFAPSWYNVFLYYRDVYSAEVQPNISCTKLGATFFDAKVFKPAALWAKANPSSTISGNSNFTKITLQYKSLSDAVEQQRYFNLSCYLSHLMFDVYRSSTRFHDAYVIDYLNKYKDEQFQHNFTSDNWNDLGVAQWGAGVVTMAIASVRTTTQIVRDGMWNFGKNKYYLNMMEYSSWATGEQRCLYSKGYLLLLQSSIHHHCIVFHQLVDGFPQTWIYSIEDARLLLHSLARRDTLGFELRRFIVYQGTTFIGDGSYFEGSVGSAGDRTFTLEANRNSFACSGPNEQACGLLDKFFNSSGSDCGFVEDLYLQCRYSYQYESNSCE